MSEESRYKAYLTRRTKQEAYRLCGESETGSVSVAHLKQRMIEVGELREYMDDAWEKKTIRGKEFIEDKDAGFFRPVGEPKNEGIVRWSGERPGQNFAEDAFNRLLKNPPEPTMADFRDPSADVWRWFGKRAVSELDRMKRRGIDKPLEKMAAYSAIRIGNTSYSDDPKEHAIAYWFFSTAGMVDLYRRAKLFLDGETDVRPWDLDNYTHGKIMIVRKGDEVAEAKPNTTDAGKHALLKRMLVDRCVLRKSRGR